MGYCPFSSFGRDTVDCIATGKGAARARARYGRASMLGRAPEPTTQRATWPGLRARASCNAHVLPGHIGVSQYDFFCIVIGGSDTVRHDPMSAATRRCA